MDAWKMGIGGRLAMASIAMAGGLGLTTDGAAQPADTSRQPRVVQALPTPGGALDARPVFALRLAKAPAGAPRALCDIAGLRSSVPVEVFAGTRRTEALKSLGVPASELAVDAAQPWIALRCQSGLPDGAPVSLRWLRPEPATDGDTAGALESWEGLRFNYTAHSEWPLLVTCARTNAAAGCNPLDKVQLAFQNEVAAADLAKVRLKGPDGKLVAPSNQKELALSGGWAQLVEFTRLRPSHRYQIVWPSRIANQRGSDVIERARKAAPLVVRMGDYPPLVKFGANFGIAERAVGGVVPITIRSVDGTGSTAQARLRTLRLTDEATIAQAYQELMRVTSADDARAWRSADDEGEGFDPGEAASAAASDKSGFKLAFPFPKAAGPGVPADTRGVSWLKPLREARSRDLPQKLDGKTFEVLGVPLAEPGFHLLEVESRALGRGLLESGKPMFVRAAALVTDLGVHLHLSNRTAAVFVSRLSTGAPVADANVSLVDCKGRRLGAARANASGWVTLDAPARPDPWGCPTYAFARAGDDLGFVQSQWQRGIETWRFEGLASFWGSPADHLAHAVIARNLLRPGEMLNARLFWRRIGRTGSLELPDAATLPKSVEIVHQGSGERRSVALSWDARGTAEVAYRLPAGVKRGVYRLSVGDGEFRVEDFRLPVMKAEVLAKAQAQVLDKPTEADPATVATDVRLSYLSGGAAANEPVQVFQRLAPLTPRFDSHPGYWFGAAGRYLWDDDHTEVDSDAEEPAVGDDKARRLDANGMLQVEARFRKPLATPRTLVTEMEYRDPNGETYRAQGRTPIWPAAFVLGVHLDPWSPEPERVADFVALDPQGRPVANAPVQVEGGFDGWVGYRRKAVGGFYSYASERRAFEPRSLCQGRTDAQGRYRCRFRPAFGDQIDSGDFRVQAVAHDAQGRAVRVASNLWVYNGGEVWFGQSDHDRIDVLADKPRYQPGETATLQVRSPFREATAWVNVMRSGTVVDTLVVPISGKQPTLQLPIKPQYAPNVFVNVLVVRGRVAQPAPTALVDLARPAYKLGIAALEVGSDAQRLNVAVKADRAKYQTREKARLAIQVTPASGALPKGRDATVFVIDEALLELMPNGTWDLFKAMTAKREYGFETASAAMQVIGKRHYGRKALPPGGGGGKSAARELFDTLLLWKGSVALDDNGAAQVEVPINDSLTRFRVVVVAHAGADRFGTGETSFIATRDLQVLSGLPATARQGDRFTAGFTVRNTTAAPLQATVEASLNDKPLPVQKVALAAGEAKGVTWPVAVGGDLSELKWRLDARASTPDGTRTDALALRQPVHTALMPARYTVGTVELQPGAAPITLRLEPPAGSVAGQGEVRVSLSPALATDAAGVREYMSHYPFFCLEQRTSKAVSLKDKRLWSIITDSIDSYVTRTGLLTYYPGVEDGGHDVLSSFVLSVSHEADMPLPPEAERRVLDALEQFVQGKLERHFSYYQDDVYGLTERKLLALEAIARRRPLVPALLDSLKVDAAKDLPNLSHRGLVQYLDILNRGKLPGQEAALKAALAELDKRLVPDGQGGLRLRSRQAENRWYLMWSESVTQVRLALLALDLPALSDRAAVLARGAVNLQRHGAAWWETQANVWGSLMLDKRAVQSSGTIGGITSIAVGRTTRVHDWAKLPQGETYVFPATEVAPERAGAIAFVHRGTGKPVAQAAGTAWADLRQPHDSNAELARTVRPVRQAVPGRWSAGDIAEVRVQFSLRDANGWVVVSDPVPTGSTVLGSGLKGQDAVPGKDPARRGWRNADGTWEPTPTYVERTFTHVRAYYEYLWRDKMAWTYQVRINNPGTFRLPPTQLEAMYDPGVFAYRPNAPLEVK